ncbi:hypothetical protein D3C87_1856780 [compost metagenome]
MNTHHRNILAAVGFAALAGATAVARNIRHYRHPLAHLPVSGVIADADNFTAYFMAQYAWITEERLMTGPGMNIRAANADGDYFDHHFLRGRNRHRTPLIN